MKFVAFSILIISICACNGNAKLNNDNINQTETTIKFITDDTDILGHWSMCAESGGGQMIQYNMCSTVIFKSDGSGSKISPGGLPEIFNWTLKNRLLRITYNTANRNNAFPDTNYVAIFKQNANNIELEIRQEKKDYSSYLGRVR